MQSLHRRSADLHFLRAAKTSADIQGFAKRVKSYGLRLTGPQKGFCITTGVLTTK